MNILFIGATGLLGKPVANAMIVAGFNVTILARNKEITSTLFPKAKVVKGDFKNLESLKTAMQGQHAVYLSLSVKQDEKESDFHSETDGLENVLLSAKELNIKRIAYLSSLVQNFQGVNNYDWWVFRNKFKAIDLLKNSGINYTIFYPSTFMESIFFQSKMGPFILLAGQSKAPMWYIAAEDFASQVVKSFSILSADNHEFYIQGIEPFTQKEAAKEFAENYSKQKLFLLKMPLAIFKFMGKFSQKANYGYHIIEALNNYDEKFLANNSWETLGKPKITLKEFALKI